MEVEKDKEKIINKIWNKYDQNCDGHLEYDELKSFLYDISILFKDPFIVQEAQTIFNLLDEDKNGIISKDELYKLLLED